MSHLINIHFQEVRSPDNVTIWTSSCNWHCNPFIYHFQTTLSSWPSPLDTRAHSHFTAHLNKLHDLYTKQRRN